MSQLLQLTLLKAKNTQFIYHIYTTFSTLNRDRTLHCFKKKRKCTRFRSEKIVSISINSSIQNVNIMKMNEWNTRISNIVQQTLNNIFFQVIRSWKLLMLKPANQQHLGDFYFCTLFKLKQNVNIHENDITHIQRP